MTQTGPGADASWRMMANGLVGGRTGGSCAPAPLRPKVATSSGTSGDAASHPIYLG